MATKKVGAKKAPTSSKGKGKKKVGDEEKVTVAKEPLPSGVLYLSANTRFHEFHPGRFPVGGGAAQQASFLISPKGVERLESLWDSLSPAQKGEGKKRMDRFLDVFRQDPNIVSHTPRKVKVEKETVMVSGLKDGLSCEDCGSAWEMEPEIKAGAALPTFEGGIICVMSPEEMGRPADGKPLYIPGTSLKKARTQKAKGLFALAQGESSVKIASFVLAQDWDQLAGIWSLMHTIAPGKIFVRACPVRPRHGFVDSKVVHTLAELKALHDETLEADPKGEWLLGEKIEAETSAIVTPTSIAIGPGHDGATAGMGSLSLPLARSVGLRMKDMPEGMRKHAEIAEPEQPYLELVTTGKKEGLVTYITQLRAGLETPRSADYIPEVVKVKKVRIAEGSHLKWEDDMRALRGEAIKQGVVVDHVGGSMISHFTLHAVANGVPILTSHRPRVGEVLQPTEGAQEPYSREDFLAGFYAYYGESSREMRKILAGSVYAFHQAAWLRGKASYILGWAVGNMHHAGVCAVSGESRHAQGRTCMLNGTVQVWPKELLSAFPSTLSRSAIFQKILDDPSLVREYMTHMTRAMRMATWEGGYGGTLWNNCLGATLKLDDSLIKIVKGAGEEEIANLIGITNQLLHLAHNNGWWFNKFISAETMNMPYWKEKNGWLLPSLLSTIFPGLQAMMEKTPEKKVKHAKTWWEAAEPVEAKYRDIAPAWGHHLKGVSLHIPKGKGFDLQAWLKDPKPQKVFIHASWNFGAGFCGVVELNKKTRTLLGKNGWDGMSAGVGMNVQLPIWLQEDDKEPTIPMINCAGVSHKKVGKKFVVTVGTVAIGSPLPLSGLDNDLHESLIGEVLSCL